MPGPLSSIDALTPAWLTEVLTARRVLSQGRVVDIEKECDAPFMATVCRLALTYSANASPAAPRKLFLKSAPGGTGTQVHGRQEARFYQMAMDDEADLPIPTCYLAAIDDATGTLTLLLEDLSDTHEALEHEIPPTEPQCYQLMEVLARLHAVWWDSPRLGVDIGTAPTRQAIAAAFDEDVANFRAFAEFLGDRLQPSRRAIFDRVIRSLAAIRLERIGSQRQLTLCHGDAHAWNFLYPREAGDSPRLLDWEALRIDIGARDVAYLIAVFWHPERRKWLEKALVRHYHEQLHANGVTGYSWDACWYDYRLSVIHLLFEPVWWWRHQTPAFLWWHRLERLMMAYEDLQCAELLR